MPASHRSTTSATSRRVRRSDSLPVPPHVTYSRVWGGLGACMAGLTAVGLWRYGRSMAVSLAGASVASLAYMTLIEPRRPQLTQITYLLPSLPAALDGLRIGQISDSHLGQLHTADNLAWAIAQMQREQPELLVLTGDLVATHQAIAQLPDFVRGLSAPLGVYAVAGNHDYWEGLAEVRQALDQIGIPLLMNEHCRLRWKGADLWLAGIDDLWEGRPDVAAALAGVPPGAFTVLLAHVPDIADESATHHIALQLSGHTHGGHLRLPLIGPFSLPRHGLRYAMGHYTVGTMALYVSRGLGGAPLRFLCRPEATIITLRCSERAAPAMVYSHQYAERSE